MVDFSVPVPDRDSAPYWAALAQGRLEVQQCRDCGRWSWPARPVCSKCQSEDLVWREVEGTGEVYSWVIAHRPYVPRLADEVPYTIALVRLDEDEGVLIPAALLPGDGVHQGMRVRAVARPLTDTVGDLIWEPLAEE
jgi:uncharacterized OB-fold protein